MLLLLRKLTKRASGMKILIYYELRVVAGGQVADTCSSTSRQRVLHIIIMPSGPAILSPWRQSSSSRRRPAACAPVPIGDPSATLVSVFSRELNHYIASAHLSWGLAMSGEAAAYMADDKGCIRILIGKSRSVVTPASW